MTDPKSIRARIRAILADRRPRPARPPSPGPSPPARRELVFGRLPGAGPAVREPAPEYRAPVRLEAETEGRVVEVAGRGRAYRIDCSDPAPAAPDGLDTGSLLFVDIEATGLSSSPLFLIGTTRWTGDRLRTTQHLARDYSEEAAAIHLFLEDARSAGRLVSFNGKSYDLPYIRVRAAATGVPFDLGPDLPHLDLLHEARRAFGDRVPNCRLTTLERHVLGRPRDDADIPGAEIPEAYHEFVRTGDARDILRILTHNRGDLVSLASLLLRCRRCWDPPSRST